jgi:hypothetical protein
LQGCSACSSGAIHHQYVKRAGWRIGGDPSALAEFKRRAANDLFGFDVMHR